MIPTGRVPALYNPNDGAVVYESAICNEYLCDLVAGENEAASNSSTNASKKLPNSDLFPNLSPKFRSQIRLWNDQFDKVIFPKVRAYILNEDTEVDQKLRQECCEALELLQGGIKGPYCFGENFAVADAHVVPFVMRWLAQLKHIKGLDLRDEPRFVHLCEWYDACQARGSVQKATIDEETIVRVHYEKVAFLKSIAKSS
ncbi:MAG: hypothetical protein SGILL_000116 [Bacillariaceae sp.]